MDLCSTSQRSASWMSLGLSQALEPEDDLEVVMLDHTGAPPHAFHRRTTKAAIQS